VRSNPAFPAEAPRASLDSLGLNDCHFGINYRRSQQVEGKLGGGLGQELGCVVRRAGGVALRVGAKGNTLSLANRQRQSLGELI
jgi:hypothetical protein